MISRDFLFITIKRVARSISPIVFRPLQIISHSLQTPRITLRVVFCAWKVAGNTQQIGCISWKAVGTTIQVPCTAGKVVRNTRQVTLRTCRAYLSVLKTIGLILQATLLEVQRWILDF